MTYYVQTQHNVSIFERYDFERDQPDLLVCTVCGALVGYPMTHADWHDRRDDG